MTIKKKDKVPSETIMTLTKMHLKECASPHTGPLVTFISFFLAKHSTMDQKSYLVQQSKLFFNPKNPGRWNQPIGHEIACYFCHFENHQDFL